MEDKINNIIELKDIALASYLYASNKVNFAGKRKLSSGEVLFQFSPKDKANEMINDYWKLNAPAIQPKLLFSAQRDLKDMIFGS